MKPIISIPSYKLGTYLKLHSVAHASVHSEQEVAIHKHAFFYQSDCDAVTVNIETCELVVDAARCIESTENCTNYTEVFVSPQ